MRLRPCIDIHNGRVCQIEGSSLKDSGDRAKSNFTSDKDSGYYADIYRKLGLFGGHIIILNKKDSAFYEDDLREARAALRAFPGGMMIGGGITDENAEAFLDAGASHVIVTSFVFKGGEIIWDNLNKLVAAIGKEHLVLDLSAIKRDGNYFIATDRWQNVSEIPVNEKTFDELSDYCDEFLVHAEEVEGKKGGIDEELASILGKVRNHPVTYAGGIRGISDIKKLYECTEGRVDVTIGSALDIFGGDLSLLRAARYVADEC